jgi:hypothetical protein
MKRIKENGEGFDHPNVSYFCPLTIINNDTFIRKQNNKKCMILSFNEENDIWAWHKIKGWVRVKKGG